MRRAKRIGRYQLLSRIAFGGMAEIYRAVTYDDEGFRHDVAVKKLLPRFVEDRQFIEMLTDEFRLVSHLKHPNIAEVYELTEWSEELIIAMEYVDGKDLRSTIEQAERDDRALSVEDAVYVMSRALDGLHHAHVARDHEGKLLHIVHRDVSPSNILLSYDGNVKLCDFGIAKATSTRIQTQTGIIKGKVKYMSPEQAFGRTLDWRSDIFSVGSVLYELVTGAAAFQAKSERDLIFAVREAAPVPAHELSDGVSPELSRIIARAMSKSRAARYQSCIDMRNDLLAYLQAAAPKYRRSDLARRLKTVWADAIEAELRALEEYVLEESVPPADLGTNLLADVLGPDAPFTHFHPVVTQHVASGDVELSPAQRAEEVALKTEESVPAGEEATDPTAPPLSRDD